MRINQKKCIGCLKCIPFCCTKAIFEQEKKCTIDADKCVECDVCLNSKVCPTDAFEQTPLKWPRTLRRAFSSVKAEHAWMGIEGRGTMEMKNNDVTNHYSYGEAGFTIDVGRPGVTATFEDVEKITMALAKLDVKFNILNPLTKLMTDISKGKLRDDVKTERFLSCIIEFKTEHSKVVSVINTLKDVAESVNTVFSVGCISRCDSQGKAPVKSILDEAGIFYRPNAKINIGLGRHR